MDFTIENQFLRICAETRGAQLKYILGADQTDYLWRGDNVFWTDRAPVLFPYVARLTNGQYTYRGKRYSMPIHGFAAESEFQGEQVCDTEIRFHLFSSSKTMEMYPFPFHFIVSYRLVENRLVQTYTVVNTGAETLYFGIGSHHGFNVPIKNGLSFEDYSLVFEPDTAPIRLGFSQDCFPNGNDLPFPLVNSTLPLHHNLFDNDAIVLRDSGNHICLKSKEDGPSVAVDYHDVPYLALWHVPNKPAPYICIEPWCSLPSRKNVLEDLETQPSLIALAPGKSYNTTLQFTFS